jgi:hypothetical protein
MVGTITAFRGFSEYGEANKIYSCYNLSQKKNCYTFRALLVHHQEVNKLTKQAATVLHNLFCSLMMDK